MLALADVPSMLAAPAAAQTAPPASKDQSQTEGGLSAADLTPEQREQLRLAIIKISQNPVGNITVLPFQSNFNYGVGPYTRLQYNLNVQPVIPIMISPSLNLVARTIVPIVNQPSNRRRPSAPRLVAGRPLASATRKNNSTSRPERAPGSSSGARDRSCSFRPLRRRISSAPESGAPASTQSPS